MAERQLIRTSPRKGPLAPGDTIEYGLTLEVSVKPGQKAWVKYGTVSAVREGESTSAAIDRVAAHVNEQIDKRIEDLSS